MYFSPLTHIPLIWRVLKGVSNSAAKSSVGCSSGSLFETTKLSSLYVRIGLEMGSWKELVSCSLCLFWYEGFEWGSWKGSNLRPFRLPGLLKCSDLLSGCLWGNLPSIFVILVRYEGFASLAVTGCAIFWHNTFTRPSLTLAGCPMMISLHAGVSTMKNWWSWNEPLL